MSSMKVAIDSGPLNTGHKVRGIGAYTRELVKAMEKVKDGDLLFTVGGHWTHTGFGPMVAFDYLNGFTPDERKMYIEYTQVTQDTVESYIENFIDKAYVMDFTKVSKTTNPDSVYDFALPF